MLIFCFWLIFIDIFDNYFPSGRQLISRLKEYLTIKQGIDGFNLDAWTVFLPFVIVIFHFSFFFWHHFFHFCKSQHFTENKVHEYTFARNNNTNHILTFRNSFYCLIITYLALIEAFCFILFHFHGKYYKHVKMLRAKNE